MSDKYVPAKPVHPGAWQGANGGELTIVINASAMWQTLLVSQQYIFVILRPFPLQKFGAYFSQWLLAC